MNNYASSDTTWRVDLRNTTAAGANISFWIVITCATAP
jgi:hypothetical protein